MIRILKIVFILCIGTSFGQENEDNYYYFYFSSSAGEKLSTLSNVSADNYGRFELKENRGNGVRIAAGDNLIVDETGIAIEKNRLITISREEIRENSMYRVSNGYLHGMIVNDSIPVARDGEDNYLFLFPVKNYLYEIGKSNKIYKGPNQESYLIFSPEENGYWTTLFVEFINESVYLKEISFDEGCSFDQIEDKTEIEGEYKTYILSPTKKEWDNLFGCYLTYDIYIPASE